MSTPGRITLLGRLFLIFSGVCCCCGEAKAEGRFMYGAGTISCAEWQKYRVANDRPHAIQAEAWLDGYLSGYNSASDDIDFLDSKPNTVALYAWVDNYCASNPLDSLIVAAFKLRKELQSRAKR